jgi:hypothetical protein
VKCQLTPVLIGTLNAVTRAVTFPSGVSWSAHRTDDG